MSLPTIHTDNISNLPANYSGIVQTTAGTIYTYLNGKLHSYNDEPASAYKSGSRAWYKHDLLHRVGFMACISKDGSGMYYLDNKHYSEFAGRSIKQYWIDCLKKYRTPQNELHIMANLLAAK